jgi:hypothetical protein
MSATLKYQPRPARSIAYRDQGAPPPSSKCLPWDVTGLDHLLKNLDIRVTGG